MSQGFAWNGGHAFVGATPPDARGAVRTAEPAIASGAFVVEAASTARLDDLARAWPDLVARADIANVFMHPALLAAAATAYPERRIVTLAAWHRDPAGSARLAGLWAFALGSAPQSPMPLAVLAAPPTPNAYLASPVIDRACVDAVLDAFLSYIADDAHLPKIVTLDALSADAATGEALARVLAARHGAMHEFRRSARPMLVSDLDAKAYFERAMSASSRKKLRQHRRRLGERGTLDSIVVSEPEAVCRAFEDFLALEASGWKGLQRTALQSDASDAAFTRAMVAALAARGEAAIHSLTLDGKPVSMQIVLRAGATAFTWKTAYDETLQDFSPGTLLFEDYTARLLADETVARVDSCSFDDNGYMATWQERAALTQTWIDARRGGSAAFTLLTRLQSAYLAVRVHAKNVYRRLLRRKGR